MQRMEQIAPLIGKPWDAFTIGAALPGAFSAWSTSFEALEEWDIKRGGSDLSALVSSSAVSWVFAGSWPAAHPMLQVARWVRSDILGASDFGLGLWGTHSFLPSAWAACILGAAQHTCFDRKPHR